MDYDDRKKLEHDREIDPEQLDVEIVKQPDIFLYWSEKYVTARSRRDRAEMQLELTKARLDGECREQPELFGLKKVTEGAVKAAIECHQDVEDDENKVIEAKEDVNLLEKIVTALDQKKRMLELLVTLHGQQFFAGPSVPRNLSEQWKKYQASVEQSVTDAQKNKTRVRKKNKKGDK